MTPFRSYVRFFPNIDNASAAVLACVAQAAKAMKIVDGYEPNLPGRTSQHGLTLPPGPCEGVAHKS